MLHSGLLSLQLSMPHWASTIFMHAYFCVLSAQGPVHCSIFLPEICLASVSVFWQAWWPRSTPNSIFMMAGYTPNRCISFSCLLSAISSIASNVAHSPAGQSWAVYYSDYFHSHAPTVYSFLSCSSYGQLLQVGQKLSPGA